MSRTISPGQASFSIKIQSLVDWTDAIDISLVINLQVFHLEATMDQSLKRNKPKDMEEDDGPHPHKIFVKNEQKDLVCTANYQMRLFRNNNSSQSSQDAGKMPERQSNPFQIFEKDFSNSQGWIQANRSLKVQSDGMKYFSSQNQANNESQHYKKQQASQSKEKQKIPSSKMQKLHESDDINSRKTKPSKIGDPPSNNKNNLVVTRGVEFVPVDQYFSKKEEAKVYEHQKAFYSITLSQSNLAKDDNKFFIVQLLVMQSNPEEFYLFSRWGRVGVIGQMSENGPLEKKNAIRQYNAKTQAKVKNGGYRIVEMSYDPDPDKQEINIGQYLTKNSTLPEPVQELIRLIFDMKMMQTHMREIGYDEKRSPLGLIAKSAIQKGYIALDNILKVLRSEKPEMQKRAELNEFSSQFYSAIPHDFGYMNMKAFVLNSEQKVKQKLEMLASLSQIQIYSNLMNEKAIDDELPDLDIQYSKLKCQIAPLSKDAAIYPILLKYLKNTHAKTHDKYTIELVEIFTVKRPQEQEKYQGHIGNKMLLWHGSRLTNFVGILSEGLKIAPYEAPSTGYMFGKGIYFADIASKSANYCLPKHNCSGLMILCQVALGQMNDKFAADYTAHNLPPGKHSTRGVGKYAPCSGQMYDDVLIPNGELTATGIQETSLLYNEYAVYSREQIKCRFIVEVNFIFKK